MATSKVSDTSVLYDAVVPLLAIGLCVPLAFACSIRTALVLGVTGAVAIVISVVLIARIGPRLPRNIRIGLSVFIAAGITMLSGMAATLLPFSGQPPFLTLVPFVIIAALLIADAPLPEPKKKLTRSIVESVITGLGFAALLCILGGLRALISGHHAVNPTGFFATVPGALLLIALSAFVGEIALARGKGDLQ